jgi:cellulose synthase/poly-beta-1,6-N-acetylglucosamine synthase-like glycosyltransferase
LTICLAILLWILGVCSLLVALYFLGITIGAWFYRAPGKTGSGNTRFAILVPAHNEGAGITRTRDDLQTCDYAPDHRKIFVIADNCTDDTATIARASGCAVFERQDTELRGKGHALQWLLTSQREELATFDVVVIVDADMYVDSCFLKAMDCVFTEPDITTAQSRYTSANPDASWLAALGFLALAVANHVRPAGRTFLGGSAGLKGSGMAFRSSLILETGWPSTSLAEDLEFGKVLALRGIRTFYAPKAIVTSDFASRMDQTRVQQARWEGGRLQVTRAYLPVLWKRLLRSPSRLVADELLDLLIPPLSILVCLLLVALALSMIAGTGLLWIHVIALLGVVAAVVTGLLQLRPPPRTYLYLFLAPAFLIFKVALVLKLVFTRSSGRWTRTPRDHERS